MTLDEWLKKKKRSSGDFANGIGVSRQQVDRYRRDGDIPGREVMDKIVAATDGSVGPLDFYGMTKRRRSASARG